MIDLITDELRSPGAYDNVLEELKGAFSEHEPVLRFLAAKDDQHRHAFYLRSQHVWYRKMGWKIMRPLFVVGVLAAIGFSLQRVIDPTVGVAVFLLGAATLYVIIQIFAHRWAYKDLARIEEVNARYKERLESLLEDLRAGRK